MIRILIVDDSLTEGLLLKSIFESDEHIKVVAIAKNGQEGITLNEKLKPDIITMDIEMPIMDGFEATRIIMSEHPVPIVIITSKLNQHELNITYRALSIGALSVFDKPHNVMSNDFNSEKQHMIAILKAMSEIKVIKRKFLSPDKKNKICVNKTTVPRKINIIAIGTSVGGPQALKLILTALPQHLNAPIVIVQHMTHGFINGFAAWLNDISAVPVKIAEHNECLQNNMIYIAPDHAHLEIHQSAGKLMAHLAKHEPVSGFCPSIDVLMKSIAQSCGKEALGLLLTGMGNDGAAGLLELKKAGGHTIIQDQESSVVFGMAGVAQSLGAVDRVIELNKIADYLVKVTSY